MPCTHDRVRLYPRPSAQVWEQRLDLPKGLVTELVGETQGSVRSLDPSFSLSLRAATDAPMTVRPITYMGGIAQKLVRRPKAGIDPRRSGSGEYECGEPVIPDPHPNRRSTAVGSLTPHGRMSQKLLFAIALAFLLSADVPGVN